MPINIPWGLCHQCPCPHSEPQPTPASPGEPPRPAGRSGPGSYGVTALPWVPVHMKPCVHPPRVESLFPPVVWSSCTQVPLAFKPKCSEGSSSQCQTPRLESLTWGSDLSLLWENLCDIIIFQLLVSHPVGMALDYIMNVPLLLSCCGFFFVFGCGISFLVGSSLFCRWLFSS